MSRAVKLDHDFDKDKLALLLSKACGSRRQKEFASDADLTPAYISKCMNSYLKNPPTPSTLKKIADCAENGVTYEELLDASGYDPSCYSGRNEMKRKNEIELFVENCKTTILLALYNNGITIKKDMDPKKEESSSIHVLINDSKIEYWQFIFLNEAMRKKMEGKMHLMMYSYIQKMLSMKRGSKISFVTDSEEILEMFLERLKVSALAIYVSVILLDKNQKDIIKELYVRTTLDDIEEVPGIR